LTRVRRFQQDDAHIFCMESQIESEIAGIFDFLSYVLFFASYYKPKSKFSIFFFSLSSLLRKMLYGST